MILSPTRNAHPDLQIDAEIEAEPGCSAYRPCPKRDSPKQRSPLRAERRAAPRKRFPAILAAVEAYATAGDLRRPPPRLRRITRIRRQLRVRRGRPYSSRPSRLFFSTRSLLCPKAQLFCFILCSILFLSAHETDPRLLVSAPRRNSRQCGLPFSVLFPRWMSRPIRVKRRRRRFSG